MMKTLLKTILGLLSLTVVVGGLLYVHQVNEERQNRLEAELGQAKADAEYQTRKASTPSLEQIAINRAHQAEMIKRGSEAKKNLGLLEPWQAALIERANGEPTASR